jgi:hypothetical protein
MIIKNLKRQDKGALKCTFSVTFPKWANFTIHNMSMFESGQKRWVNFPGYSYEKDGKKKFFAYCRFEENSNQEAFQSAILKTLDEALKAEANPRAQIANAALDDNLPF